MEASNRQKIGTHFKKENIFLATVSGNTADTKEILKSKVDGKVSDGILECLVDSSVFSSEQYDIFYKDDSGYTRFVEEGPETFVGDDSDGKGIIRNIISIWDYYSEDQVFEVMINNEFMAICTLDDEPLERYNQDFNLS